MAPDVASALISGAAGIGSTLFNVGSQSSTNDANIRLARENRNFYYQQWMRENAYNDPSAVMQRLQRAGLNPSLMYGEGAGGLPASASMAEMQSAHVSAPTIDPLMMAQIANLNADAALKKTQGEKNLSDIDVNRGIIKVNDSVVAYNSALTSYTKSQQDYVIGQTQMLGTLTDQYNSQIALNYASISNMQEQRKIDWANLDLKEQETKALVDKYGAETGYTQEMIKYYGKLAKAKIVNLNADSALKDAQKGLTDEEVKRVQQDVANMTIVNGQLQWNLQMSREFDEAQRQLAQWKMATEIVTDVVNSSRDTYGPVKVSSRNLYNQSANSIGTLIDSVN